MTEERLREIAETLRMFARAQLDALTPTGEDTLADCLSCYWAEFEARLRQSAEFSAYVPNSMRWSRMADELRAWALERDRADAEAYERTTTNRYDGAGGR